MTLDNNIAGDHKGVVNKHEKAHEGYLKQLRVFEDGYSDDSSTSTDEQLVNLFRVCDRNEKGYIIEEELEELCLSLGISSEDSNTLFRDLDADSDGRISFRDFSSGFKEFLIPEDVSSPIGNHRRRASMWNVSTELNQQQERSEQQNGLDEGTRTEAETSSDTDFERRRKESIVVAWTNFTTSLMESNLLSLAPESQSQVRQLCRELQGKTIPPMVATKVECAVTSLMKEMEKLQKENKDLEELYERERSTHVKTLQSLEVEMEDQVAKLEERAQAKAKLEQEEEKRQLRQQMDQEVAEMQAHLRIFQKVDAWLKKNRGPDQEKVQEVRKKLEESCNTNRELRTSLQDTTTNLALLRSDLAHSRLQYEEKCKELHEERENVLEYMHQYDHLRRQLDLIHDANKRLQDTNDNLRENLESEWKQGSGQVSRNSSMRSSLRRSLKGSFREAGDSSGQFGIRRLLDDLDSGLSTLPDKGDEGQLLGGGNYMDGTGLCSLEDELKNLPSTNSSGEVSLIHPSSKASQGQLEILESSQRSSKTPSPALCRSYFTKHLTLSLDPSSPDAKVVKRESYFDFVSDPPCPGPPDRTYKVVLAGDAAVGKSTFIARICDGVFVSDMASTLGVDYKVKSFVIDSKHVVLQLWDTAGQERFRSITKSYFRRADGVLLLYDVTNERSFVNVRQWVQDVEDSCENRVPITLCGNKKDLRETSQKSGLNVVSTSVGERLANEFEAPFYETSTKNGDGVMDAVFNLARQMATSEDIAVQTSALRVISGTKKKRGCCFLGK